MHEVTRILDALENGDSQAADKLLPLVYDELRRIAASKMARERPGQTLQPTALVHEAWLRVSDPGARWQSRAHFFGAAAEAMRRILIDNARRKNAVRHGGGMDRTTLDGEIASANSHDELLELNEALERFVQVEPEKAEVVKLRYFVGLTIEETAEVLGISEPTAKRYWAYARAWLFREIHQNS
ncbi:MAG: sigma-70 family RNA polymerase sigma factor [Verrucomicrobiota bacterium]|jgi:RNA polymerase sigma factor (TIGR02999 family)